MLKYKVEDRMMVPAVKAHPWTNQPVNLDSYTFEAVVSCSKYKDSSLTSTAIL